MGFQPTRRWRGREPIFGYSPGSVRGTGYTFTRNTAATCTSDQTVITNVDSGQLREAHYVLANDGITYRTTLLELQSTNLCLQSENFAVTWTPVGTPTRGAQDSSIGVTLTLIGDDDATAAESFRIIPTFTGDGVKSLSIFGKKGASPSANGWTFRLRDNSVVTDRMLATITWDVGGVPTVTMTTGTYIGKIDYGNGFYRFLFQSTSVTAANTNMVDVCATRIGTVGDTGDVYAGGVQVEDVAVPTSYLKTTTGTVSRSADVLYFPFTAGPREMTVYIDAINRGTVVSGSTARLWEIGNGGNPRFLANANATQIQTFFMDAAGNTSTSVPASGAVAYGDRMECASVLTPTGAAQGAVCLNGGTIVTAAAGTARGLPGAFSDTKLYPGGPTPVGAIAIMRLTVLRGTKTIPQCRAA